MRRLIILIFILFMMMTAVFANEKVIEDISFDILAYKINPEDYLKVLVTDAINESLGVLSNGDSIDLSDHVEELIDSSKVIFSYRVVGLNTTTVDLSFSISPLMNEVGKEISADYEGVYSTLGVNGSGSRSGMYFIEEGVKGSSYNETAGQNLPTISWSWYTGTGLPEWIARGAVSMSIDSDSYDSADIGTYTADVYVNITYN